MKFEDMKWKQIVEHLNEGEGFTTTLTDGTTYTARGVQGESSVYVLVWRGDGGKLQTAATGRLSELVDLMEQQAPLEKWQTASVS